MILYVEHDMNQLNPISIVKGGVVNNPSITSNNTNINTVILQDYLMNLHFKIRKSISNNAPITDTKGNISMNDVNDFIRVLYSLSQNSESILNETDVWDGEESRS